MAMERTQIPHDKRTTIAAMAAVIAIAAILTFLMITLVRNVGAY